MIPLDAVTGPEIGAISIAFFAAVIGVGELLARWLGGGS
jgi:hypothetical protein